MSFYNYQANVFVNNTQNPKLKMNDIQESVNLLYSVLMSGEATWRGSPPLSPV